MAAFDEVSPVARVLMKHPREAFVSQAAIDAQWRTLNFTAPPDFARAVDEYDRFAAIISACGAEMWMLPRDDRLNLDSIYSRDASIVCPQGSILCAMGKVQRAPEPAAQAAAFETRQWPVVGRIEPPGLLEGGDVVWLDGRTVAVGEGRRTNAEGIRQLTTLLGSGVEVVAVPLPDWRGPQDVMHLMSIISPVDADLALIYSPLMPGQFRRVLLDRGMTLIEVSDDEFESMGINVLAVAPSTCVMLSGNPATRGALERAGAAVHEYDGVEISLKGGGGPTCLTRPLIRGWN